MMTSQKKEAVRRVLGLSDAADLSVLLWHPADDCPQESCRVLIQFSENGRRVCSAAYFDNGRFSVPCHNGSRPFPGEEVLGWSYYPFDGT